MTRAVQTFYIPIGNKVTNNAELGAIFHFTQMKFVFAMLTVETYMTFNVIRVGSRKFPSVLTLPKKVFVQRNHGIGNLGGRREGREMRGQRS